MDNITIGILGLGHEASGKFYLDLNTKLVEEGLVKSNIDYPPIIMNTFSPPSLLSGDVSEEELSPVKKNLKILEDAGASFIVMACNTIHLYYDRLIDSVNIPIINLRDEVKNHLIENDVKSITVLGTPLTMLKGLYKFENIKYVMPEEKEIQEISKSIFDFMCGSNPGKLIENIAEKYASYEENVILLGCTEVSLMAKKANVSKIDATTILIEATLKKYLELIK